VDLGQEFLDKSKKALELIDKVESLRAAGTLTGDRYEKYRKSLDDKLRELRDENINAIDKRRSTIADALSGFDAMGSAIMSEAMRQEKKAELEGERGTIEAEKALLEVCSLQEYAKTLRQKTAPGAAAPPRPQTAREYATREHPPSTIPAEYVVPAWAKGVAALLIAMSVISGFSSKSGADIVVKPVYTAIYISVLTVGIHLASRLFGLGNASWQRAFSATMKAEGLILLANIAIGGLATLALGSSVNMTEISPDTIIGLLGSLILVILAMLVVDAILFVLSVSSTYEAGALKSAGVSLVGTVVAVILAVMVLIPLAFILPSPGAAAAHGSSLGATTYSKTVTYIPTLADDMARCAGFQEQKDKDMCYSTTAWGYKKPDICAKVLDAKIKAGCLKNAS
jgi:hypothetical protein